MPLGGMTYRYITSDCDAVATVYEYQHYTKNPEDAVADVLKAGLYCVFLLIIIIIISIGLVWFFH